MLEVKDEVLGGGAKYRIRNSEGDIIYDDCDIEMITPVLQEGTELNKTTIEDLDDSIRDYQVATSTAVNISESTTSTIWGQLDDDVSDGGTTLSGYCKGNQDGNTWGFKISTSLGFSFATGASSTEMALYASDISSGDDYRSVKYMNNALSNDEESQTYSLNANPGTNGATLTYEWDLLESRTCVINYQILSMTGNIRVRGSNDNASWTTLDSLNITSSTQASYRVRSITSSTAYRYYRVELTINSSYAGIRYLYLSDAPDTMLKYRNEYTIPQKLREYEEAHYKIFAQRNSTTVNRMQYVTENTLNGAPIDRILYPNQLYDLRGDHTSLTTCAGTFRITKYTVSASDTVNFSHEPKFIIVVKQSDLGVAYVGTVFGKTYTPSSASYIYAFF